MTSNHKGGDTTSPRAAAIRRLLNEWDFIGVVPDGIFETHTAADLDLAAAELNARPRKTLGWHTPAEALARILSQPATTTGVARTP